ncbi:MAG: SulP family inorganic anion transporter [Gemmatimonadales bacterium]
MLVPKLFSTLRSYHRRQFLNDIAAGVIVGIVALPLAIAFAVASGVTPERGLYTAIIAGFIISALGGSRVQIGGPTGAFIVIVYAIVQQYGVDGLQLAGLMAGVLLIGFGLARLGAAIKFIPHTVVIGFTSGIAVVIVSSEVKDFLGLHVADVPAAFVPKWQLFLTHLTAINPWAVAIALGSMLILWLWPRVSHRIPGPFVVVIAAAIATTIWHLPVETIGSRFGAIHAGLPAPILPHVTVARISQLIGPAFTIALLGSVESLLSAVVADGMIGGRHRSNMELVAQGIANIASPLFGGIPATGAIARTATNVKNGGRTPVAGMVHAITLLLITLFFGRWAGLIPMAALAGILVVVAYHMSEWRSFRSLLRSPRSDVLVLVVTFLLTVFVDLTTAIEVGMVLAAFLFMKRMAEVTNVTPISREFADPDATEEADMEIMLPTDIPAEVQVYEINGPFFFGAAETFRNAIDTVASKPKTLIIRLRHVPAMDATGIHTLRTLVRQARGEGIRVILSGLHAQPMVALAQSGFLDEVGENDLAASLPEALRMAGGLDRIRSPDIDSLRPTR